MVISSSRSSKPQVFKTKRPSLGCLGAIPHGAGLLWLANEVWLVRLHNQSVSVTSFGTHKRTRQKGNLDPLSSYFTSRETEVRTGGMIGSRHMSKAEPTHLKTDTSSTKKKCDELSILEVSGDNVEVEKSFFPVSLSIRMVDSNQFPLFQHPPTQHKDDLKPQLTQTQSVSFLK